MVRSLPTVCALCLLAAAVTARADLSYSYVEGSGLVNSTDTAVGDDEDGKGGEAWVSYELISFLHLFGGAKYVEFDDLPVETTTVQAGVGLNYDFSPTNSLYFNVGAITSEADVVTPGGPTVGTDDDGVTYALGYREATKTGKTEFVVAAEHVDFSESDFSDTWLDMGLLFRVTPRLKVQAAVQFGGEENGVRVGVRYYLPNRLDRRDE
jgi:predicted porin